MKFPCLHGKISIIKKYEKHKDNEEERFLEKKFKELYLSGEIEFEAIDDYSYEWGMSEEDCTLREYLGFNEEEEDAWVSIGEEALLEILDKQKKEKE